MSLRILSHNMRTRTFKAELEPTASVLAALNLPEDYGYVLEVEGGFYVEGNYDADLGMVLDGSAWIKHPETGELRSFEFVGLDDLVADDALIEYALDSSVASELLQEYAEMQAARAEQAWESYNDR